MTRRRQAIALLGDRTLLRKTHPGVCHSQHREGAARADRLDAHRVAVRRSRRTWRIGGQRTEAPKALRRAFNVAIGKGILGRNPCPFVERPSHRPARREFYAAAQVAKLLDVAKTFRLGAMVRLGVVGALRPGELFALRWEDVDLKRGIIDVRHSLQERPRILVPAKAKSARRIPLERETATLLERHQRAMRAEKHRSPFVFVTERGKMMSEKVANAALREIVLKVKLPPLTMYGLRPTAISLFSEAGVHLRVAADVAGHSTTDLTANVYTHTGEPQHREGIQRVARLIRSARGRKRTNSQRTA